MQNDCITQHWHYMERDNIVWQKKGGRVLKNILKTLENYKTRCFQKLLHTATAFLFNSTMRRCQQYLYFLCNTISLIYTSLLNPSDYTILYTTTQVLLGQWH